jgi:protein RecA
MLDAVISNVSHGGLPEGRIVEIQGPPSIGKSHIGFELAKSTQKLGGIVVYIDTENATSLDNLRGLGIKVNSQFVFVQSACTEEIFEVAEQAIMKARQLKKDVPVTIIWDSVAASSPKAELEGDYDQNSIGLQARVLGKGLRKITNLIANQKVLFVLFNQQRMKIGVMYGDPTTTPGGAAIPYACSTRIRLYGGSQILDEKTKEVIGIAVKAKTIKNKVARPFREAEFEIHFGIGVREDQQAFDAFRRWCDAQGPVKMENGEQVSVAGSGAWKSFLVTDKNGTTLIEEKWQGKADFGSRVYYNQNYEMYVTALLDAAFVVTAEHDVEHPTYVDVDSESYEDVRSLAHS